MFARLFQLPIRLYSVLISPLLPRSCRFHPTCSGYGLESLKTHGAFKGSVLALWRIIRCNPWHKGQYHDPVPEVFEWRDLIGYKRQGSRQKK